MPCCSIDPGAGDSIPKRSAAEDERIARLCEEYAWLPPVIAGSQAKRTPRYVNSDDLESAAWEGLFIAARDYDPERGKTFEHWASQRIRHYIIDEVRRLDRASRDWRKRQRLIEHVRESMRDRKGRAPREDRIAAALALTPKQWREHVAFIPALLEPDELQVEHEMAVFDDYSGFIPTDDDDLIEWLMACIEALPPRQRRIITETFWLRRTQTSIGHTMGVTGSRITQITTIVRRMIADAIAFHMRGDPGRPLTPKRAAIRDAYRARVGRIHAERTKLRRRA